MFFDFAAAISGFTLVQYHCFSSIISLKDFRCMELFVKVRMLYIKFNHDDLSGNSLSAAIFDRRDICDIVDKVALEMATNSHVLRLWVKMLAIKKMISQKMIIAEIGTLRCMISIVIQGRIINECIRGKLWVD